MSDSEQSLGTSTKLGSAGEFAAQYGYTALRFYLLSIGRAILRDSRLNICWRYPLPERKTVDVIYSDERQRARASGTMKCGMAWVCPVCSAYIAERRRVELGRALLNSREKYATVMITYTAKHDKSMRLNDTLVAMQKAYKHAKSGRAWVEIRQEFGMVGSVRAIEITYGESGWHPHYHELLFFDVGLIQRDYDGSIAEYALGLEAIMVERWIAGLNKNGMTASEEIGLKISSTDDDVVDYIAKYGKMPLEHDFKGATDEITRGTAKTARNGNFGVWEILFRANGNRRFANLFKEYVAATKGRSQLQWSRGLLALLNIEEIRDEIACEGVETDTDRVLASIDVEFWRLLADKNHIAQVMTVANTGDEGELKALLKRIQDLYKEQGWEIPQFDLGH